MSRLSVLICALMLLCGSAFAENSLFSTGAPSNGPTGFPTGGPTLPPMSGSTGAPMSGSTGAPITSGTTAAPVSGSTTGAPSGTPAATFSPARQNELKQAAEAIIAGLPASIDANITGTPSVDAYGVVMLTASVDGGCATVNANITLFQGSGDNAFNVQCAASSGSVRRLLAAQSVDLTFTPQQGPTYAPASTTAEPVAAGTTAAPAATTAAPTPTPTTTDSPASSAMPSALAFVAVVVAAIAF